MLRDVLLNFIFAFFGGIVGLFLGAAFDERLRNRLRQAQRRRRRRHMPVGSIVAPHLKFRLGPLVTPAYIYEGDGTTPFMPEHVTIRVAPTEVKLPNDFPEFAEWRREIAIAQQERINTVGEPEFWNGLRYAVAGVKRSREYRHEEPRVTFRLQHTDYYTFLAAQQLDRPLSDGTTLRQRYVDGRDVADVPAFLACSFGVNVAVITKDDRLVITLRSEDLGSGRNQWNSSANEGLSREIDSSGRSEPNLFRVAERGLREELALEYGEYDIALLGFAVDTERHQWAALFSAELRSLTAPELRERHSRGISDRWEHKVLEYVTFEPQTVIRYLLTPDRIESWAPCAPVLFYFSLVYHFGHQEVEKAVRQVLQELGSSEPRRRLLRVLHVSRLWVRNSNI
ncbi:MAG: hypothetical protein LC775_12990 [Acidobacteria bacterium]|nr:hypothetical protein [Acidobacteriota bacterium]